MPFPEKPFWWKLSHVEGGFIMGRSWTFNNLLRPGSFRYALLWAGVGAVNYSICAMKNNYDKNKLFFRMLSAG
jgi:hypothetical protein